VNNFNTEAVHVNQAIQTMALTYELNLCRHLVAPIALATESVGPRYMYVSGLHPCCRHWSCMVPVL